MLGGNGRLEDLRRRVQRDPASIAFAQLAEEYRRAGHYQQAVDTCRAGLAIHPAYLSARVTLGRALVELHHLDEAQQELERVLRSAPENLAAIRTLAEIHRLRGSSDAAPSQPAPAAVVERQPPRPRVDEDVLLRAVRTIAALERWLTAIHVTRSH